MKYLPVHFGVCCINLHMVVEIKFLYEGNDDASLPFSMYADRAAHLRARSVHDEVIVECVPDTSVEQVCNLMEQTPDWAEGLLLRADGYECEFYMKQ